MVLGRALSQLLPPLLLQPKPPVSRYTTTGTCRSAKLFGTAGVIWVVAVIIPVEVSLLPDPCPVPVEDVTPPDSVAAGSGLFLTWLHT